MKSTGIAELPLHYGNAPLWLFRRMVDLGKCVFEVLVDEYGQREVLSRLANPHWFQALSCVLGYDWHSSGTTTVTCAALKTALRPNEHGLAVAGGKGRLSRETPKEIERIGKAFNWSTEQISKLKYASRMSAKVDNAAIQAGYSLYHHTFFMDWEGRWLVIQQGMNVSERSARRYHWFSDHVQSYVVEPHEAIVGDIVRKRVLDMTSRSSNGSRKASVDLVNDGPTRIKRHFLVVRSKHQETLRKWMSGNMEGEDNVVPFLSMPIRLNWEALKRAYEFSPRNYEELLSLRGIGPSTVRGLAFVSALLYGEAPSWKDPVRYSFAYGGKDGIPFPVDRSAMDESVQFLREALERAKIGNRERLRALNRLKDLVPDSGIKVF